MLGRESEFPELLSVFRVTTARRRCGLPKPSRHQLPRTKLLRSGHDQDGSVYVRVFVGRR
jgi:hypothetical protein